MRIERHKHCLWIFMIVLSIGNADAGWDRIPPASDSVIEDRRSDPPPPPRKRGNGLASIGAPVAPPPPPSPGVLLTMPLIILLGPLAPFHLPAAAARP